MRTIRTITDFGAVHSDLWKKPVIWVHELIIFIMLSAGISFLMLAAVFLGVFAVMLPVSLIFGWL